MELYLQRYEWGRVLSGFGRPMGLGNGVDGCLLVTDMDHHSVLEIDTGCERYRCHLGPGHIWGPWLTVRAGHTLARAARRPDGWSGPHGVAQDARGQFLVTCYYNPKVYSLDCDGRAAEFLGKDQLKGPATLRIDAQGRLWLAEYALNLLLVFSADGDYLGRIGLDPLGRALRLESGSDGVPATKALGGFDRLHMALCQSDGAILVADTWNNRIQRLGSDGAFDAVLMDGSGWRQNAPSRYSTVVAASKRSDERIACPVALDVNVRGRLLVTAWGSSRLLLFDAQGRTLPLELPVALNKPYDARFWRRGLVVADTHNGRVLLMDNLP